MAPTAALEVPAGQGRHAANVWPDTGLYVPGGHAEQVEAEAPPGRLLKSPAGHASQATAPGAAEKAPGGHWAQAGLAGVAEKAPGEQRTQAVARDVPPPSPPAAR